MPNALDHVADRKPAIGLAKVEHKKHSGIQRPQREQRREKCAEQTGAPAAKQAAPVQDDSGHQDDEVDDEQRVGQFHQHVADERRTLVVMVGEDA